MYEQHTVGVVVPAYDEEAFIGDVIREMPAFVDRLYVIDDDSTDNTWEAIRTAAENRAETAPADTPTEQSVDTAKSVATNGGLTQLVDGQSSHHQNTQTDSKPHIQTDEFGSGSGPESESASEAKSKSAVESEYADLLAGRISVRESIGAVVRIKHETNRGAGGAIKTGYLAAIADEMDIIATVDADGQMDCTMLSELLDPLVADDADYAKGNRFYNVDVTRKMPRFRLAGNLLLTGLTRISSGYWRLRDPQNGFTAATRETLVEADIETLWTYYGYMNQLMVRFSMNDVRIADVPMETTYGDEESNIEYIPYIRKVSSLLLRTFLARLTGSNDRRTQGAALCYLFGVAGVLGTVYRTASGIDADSASKPSLVIPAVLGCIILITGIGLDHQSTPDVIRCETD